MNILAIDYGKSHLGLAVGSLDTKFAEPLKIPLSPQDIQKVHHIFIQEKIDLIIIGSSEGISARNSFQFANQLKKGGLPIEMVDETLTTQDARKKTLHLSSKKRSQIEHSAAAAIILQNWFDIH